MDATLQPHAEAKSLATPSQPSAVSGGVALLLVLLALSCGLLSGLIVGGAGGFIAGRSAAQGENVLDSLRQAIGGGRAGRSTEAPSAAQGTAGRFGAGGAAPSAEGTEAPSGETPGSAGPEPTPAGTESRVPYLGVLVQTMPPSDQTEATPESAETPGEGALVLAVEPDSPAQRAGLEAGDRIVAVDGRPIRSAADLKAAIQAAGIGARLTLRVVRGQEERDIPVVVGSRQADAEAQGRPDLRVLPLDPSDPDLRELLDLLPPELRRALEDALRSGQWPPVTPAIPGAGET